MKRNILKNYKILIFALLFSYSLIANNISAAEIKTLNFVVHPFKSPTKLASMFSPLLKNLEKTLGYKINFRTGRSYQQVINLYKQGLADFGYLGPAGYVKAANKKRVVPLVRIQNNGKGTFNGVIVVNDKSDIVSIKDLEGKRFAFGDKNSTLSHFVPHYMLLKANVSLKKLSKYSFTGNHDNVARGVLLNLYDAGGLKPSVAKNYLDKGLRILATSEPISEHLFVANSKMNSALRKKIKQALLSMPLKPLQAIKKKITGVETVESADYDNLRIIIKLVNQQNF